MPKTRNEIAGHKSGTGRNSSTQQGQRICSDVTESMQPPSQPSTHSSPPTRSEPTGRPCYKHSRDDWLDVMTTCHRNGVSLCCGYICRNCLSTSHTPSTEPSSLSIPLSTLPGSLITQTSRSHCYIMYVYTFQNIDLIISLFVIY